MTREIVLAACFLSATLGAQDRSAAAVSLDALAGKWTLHDAAGAPVGESTVQVQVPGAMLYEERRVGDGRPQPLWFANFEADGWRQLFVGIGGTMREFATESPAGQWPLVMGANVVTQDGATTKFRMTIARPAKDESRRVLEASRDAGRTWSTVFDYTYRR